MFKYQKLADILQRLKSQNLQLKDLIYNQEQKNSNGNGSKSNSNSNSNHNSNSNSNLINPAVAYSNLSLILNNWNKFEEMHARIQRKARKASNANANKKNKNNRGKNSNKNDFDGEDMRISNKNLFYVLVAEYLNVGKIKGGGKLKRIVMENLGELPELEVGSKMNKERVQVRLRSNKNNKDSKNNGVDGDGDDVQKWTQLFAQFDKTPIIPNSYNLSYSQYSTLRSQNPQFSSTPSLVIQSLSSSLPAVLLTSGLDTAKNSMAKFDIIDACSAPGNKTLQLGEFLGDRGTVYAFEKDQRRYKVLCGTITKYGADNVQPILGSFLDAQPTDQKFNKVKLILLDPSCSGSGMLTNFTRDSTFEQNPQPQHLPFQLFISKKYTSLTPAQQSREDSLQAFQLSLLSHASKFKPQRISYSTCSIFEQENENVVEKFLQQNPDYQIKKVFGGSSGLEEGSFRGIERGFGKRFKQCVRVDPRGKATDGFFVCIFKRKNLTVEQVNK